VKILDRYLLRQFVVTFVLLVLGIPILFVITDLTDNLDKYLGRGLPLSSVAASYLYSIPQFVFWAMPIAALVATVFTIGNMTRYQEIAAAKAGGVSFFRLIVPIIGVAAVLSVLGVGLGEVVTVTNQKRAELLGERRGTSSPFRMNFVFQTEGGRTLSVRRLDSEAREMSNLVVERAETATKPAVHQTVQRARWTPESGWTLEEGHLRVLEEGGGERSFAFASARIPALRESPEELLAEPKRTEEMSYAEITRFINAIERSGGNSRKLQVEQAQKIALPLAILVIVLFGAPLSTSSQRGGTAYGIGISLAVTMIYLMLFRVGTAVGSSGALDPLVAAWMPNVLFLVAGLFLLSRVRT
jgi:lipopolysaccharide export system permease protein